MSDIVGNLASLVVVAVVVCVCASVCVSVCACVCVRRYRSRRYQTGYDWTASSDTLLDGSHRQALVPVAACE